MNIVYKSNKNLTFADLKTGDIFLAKGAPPFIKIGPSKTLPEELIFNAMDLSSGFKWDLDPALAVEKVFTRMDLE